VAKGSSGRIVVEIDPEIKLRLYGTLGKQGLTLKAWFLHSAERYIQEEAQLSLDLQNPAAVGKPEE
jgi:hypothetical protein